MAQEFIQREHVALGIVPRAHLDSSREALVFLDVSKAARSSSDKFICVQAYALTGAVGFAIASPADWWECLSVLGSVSGPVGIELAVINNAAGLFGCGERRANTPAVLYHEAGIAQSEGVLTHGGADWYALSLMQKFAHSGTRALLTGVDSSEAEGDACYSLGEGGASCVSIATTAAGTVSASHGGGRVKSAWFSDNMEDLDNSSVQELRGSLYQACADWARIFSRMVWSIGSAIFMQSNSPISCST